MIHRDWHGGGIEFFRLNNGFWEGALENHGKLLIADGLRGIVTSENLLSYGGEKGRHETRELGLMFWSPVIARRILGRVRLHWPAALAEDSVPDGPPLAWIAAGDEAWHGLAAIAGQLEFDWRAAGFLEHVVRDELTHAPDDADARAKIDPMLRQAWGALAPYGQPDVPEDGRQHRVEVALDGVPVPCIGYTDFVFHAHGCIIDLKTSSTLPSSIKVAHARQGAVYARAFSNYSMRFAYCTPKKSTVYVLENPADHLAALANIARRLDRFLSVSADPQELAAIVCPDYDSFYWSDPQTRANGLALFGF